MLTAAAYHLHILHPGGLSPEDHLHVLGAAPAAHPPVHVPVARGGDEEVALPRLELHLHRGRGKGSANITSVKIFLYTIQKEPSPSLKFHNHREGPARRRFQPGEGPSR